MKLHMADIHLHRARLFRDKAALAEARKLIEHCGYWRRKEELEDAEEAAKNWPNKPDYPPVASATETTAMNTQPKRFRIALSFPGEHRPFVEQVAKRLASHVGQDRVLYDKYYEAEFARPDLDTYLQRLYHDESELIAVFLCADYERKEWCGLEWRALRDLIKRRKTSAIMPLRFDNTEIPGLFSTDGYVWIGNRTPHEVADVILQRLQINPETSVPTQPVPPTPPSAALKLWHEKLAFLQAREAVISDPAQLFTLKQQIEEAKGKVREHGGQP